MAAKYRYDKWNRIVREDNHRLGKTYTWEYDIGGNITEKRTYALCAGDAVSGEYTSDTYEYASAWKDQLVSFNGEACAYDALGNPTTYRGKALEWTKVRRLAKFGDVEFTYNAAGLRTSKTANGVTHSYLWDEDKILKESFSNGLEIIYYYGEDGIIGFSYGGVDYYYRKNIQGDVIGIYTSSGAKVASYVYDAWGNHKIFDANGNEVTSATHIGYINPIRYREYYFDVETGIYYVKERYYDPEIGRWINADNVIAGVGSNIKGYNLFTYCFNNPINMDDLTGQWPRWITATVAAVAAVVAVVATVVSAPVVATVAGTVAVVSNVAYVAQSHHYDKRKAKNNNLPKTPQEADDLNWKNSNPKSDINPNGGGPAANCHQYTSPDKSNVKFVSPDGHREVIYDSTGNMVLDSRDIGTYNYSPSGTFWGSIGHFFADMLPWYLFGNDDDDPGPLANEIIRLFE